MKLTLISLVRDFTLKTLYWRSRRSGKIIFCRPRGGLNDLLCQIDRCRVYAIKSNRDLWVDTSYSGLNDCLSNYFEASNEFYFGSPNDTWEDASCVPEFLTHRLNSYESMWTPKGYIDKERGGLLTFNFKSNYKESLLLHEQSGGGRKSIFTLRLLRLKQDIRKKIKRVIENLGEYDSIHVRNTDILTDYKSFFDELKNKISGKVVVCTDDFRCQQYAKKFWGDKLVVVYDVPDTKGKPLHGFTNLDRYTANIGVLMDLLVLAAARNFFCRKMENGKVSGFAQLVKSLHANHEILRKLIEFKP